jgi:hypothetical protein
MIYEMIDDLSREEVSVVAGEVQTLNQDIARLEEAVKVEDSKRKEAEMRTDIESMKKKRRLLSGKISCLREEAFKKALAEEYDVVGNPKFDRCYSIAYSHGHSSGFSEVEIFFSDIVELIK